MEEKTDRRRLIRRPAVLERIGLKTTELYELIKQDRFPRPVPLGRRAVAWLEDEVDAWIEARIQARSAQRERRK